MDSSDQGFPLIPKFLAICTVGSVFYGITEFFAKLQEIRPFVNKAVKLFKSQLSSSKEKAEVRSGWLPLL